MSTLRSAPASRCPPPGRHGGALLALAGPQSPTVDAVPTGAEPLDRQAGPDSGDRRAHSRPGLAQCEPPEHPGPASLAGECPSPAPALCPSALYGLGVLPPPHLPRDH